MRGTLNFGAHTSNFVAGEFHPGSVFFRYGSARVFFSVTANPGIFFYNLPQRARRSNELFSVLFYHMAYGI